MDEQQINELWTRLLDEDLSQTDEAQLEEALSDDAARRDRAVDDAEMDGLLRALGCVEAGEEDFVAQVSARLNEAHHDIPVFPANKSVLPVPPAPPNQRSVKPPPIPPPLDDTPTAPGPPPVSTPARRAVLAKPTDERHRSSLARSRQRWTLAITAAALLVAATVTVVVIVANQDGEPVARDPNPTPPTNTDTPSPAPRPWPPIPKRHGTDNIARSDTPDPLVPDPRVPERPKRDPVTPPMPPDDDPERLVKSPDPPEKVADKPEVVGPTDNARIVARLTKTTDAIWDEQPQDELTTEPLLLREGSAQITMNDGAVVTVQGPAEFQLDSAKSLLLRVGRISALVPEEAIGFTVQTPSSRVVDLGTQFDLSVQSDGATAVRCNRGKVQIDSLAADGAPRRQWKLGEGQFKWLARDGSAHDWSLTMQIDGAGRGSIDVNGLNFSIGGLRDFLVAQRQVTDEFTKAQRAFSTRTKPKDGFSGVVNVNGNRLQFDDRASFYDARRQTTRYFDLLSALMRRLDSIRGSFNVNGKTFNFNNMQELLKAQQEMMERFGAAADDLRGAMKVGDKQFDFGNFQDMMKSQQEMFRGFGGGGAAGGFGFAPAQGNGVPKPNGTEKKQ